MTTLETLPLDAAAGRLGVSVEAVRMRVRRGTLPSVKRGGRLYVQLSPAGETTGRAQAEPTDQPGADRAPSERGGRPPEVVSLGGRDALVGRLEADVAFLQAALEREQIANAELRRLLAASLPALPARAPETGEKPPTTVEAAETPRRPWWRLWAR